MSSNKIQSHPKEAQAAAGTGGRHVPAPTEEERFKAAKLIEKAKANICLDWPFFASLLLRRKIEEHPQVPTLGVTNDGQIYYNPKFVCQFSTDQIVWALCHEVMHYASMHPLRRGPRDPLVFNIAGDAWINTILRLTGVGKPIPHCVNTEGGMIQVADAENKTPEQIYDELMKSLSEAMKQAFKGEGDGQGDGMGDDMVDSGRPMTESEKAEREAQTKLEVAEASQTAKMFGKMPGPLAQFVADVIESKVPWYDILERFMTERVKNDYSWARPNRRYAPDFYLPSMDGVGAMGPIVIQVDISGSVSKREIEHYNGHMKRIVELCHPSRVYVIYTDTQVQRCDEFTDLEEVEIRFYSGGGTDMRAGFSYLEEHGIEPEVVVTLTDGYTPFPDETAFPAVWCISSDVNSPTGETVHFSVAE